MSARTARLAAAAAIALPLTATGCFTYGSYQSARPVEPGHPRATFSCSRNDVQEDGDDSSGWLLFEGMGRRALGRHADFGIRLSLLQGDRGSTGGGIATLDVKVAEPTNHLAFALPVSILLWSTESISIGPGVLGTLPIGPHFEVNGAARVYFFPSEPSFHSSGFNLGLGIFPVDRNKWGLRPEVGWLRLQDSGVAFFQFGIAVDLPLTAATPR